MLFCYLTTVENSCATWSVEFATQCLISVAEVMPVHWHFYSPILASKKRLPLETHQSIVLLRDEDYSICVEYRLESRPHTGFKQDREKWTAQMHGSKRTTECLVWETDTPQVLNWQLCSIVYAKHQFYLKRWKADFGCGPGWQNFKEKALSEISELEKLVEWATWRQGSKWLDKSVMDGWI